MKDYATKLGCPPPFVGKWGYMVESGVPSVGGVEPVDFVEERDAGELNVPPIRVDDCDPLSGAGLEPSAARITTSCTAKAPRNGRLLRAGAHRRPSRCTRGEDRERNHEEGRGRNQPTVCFAAHL